METLRWSIADFSIDGGRYIVRHHKDTEKYKYEIVEVGTDYPVALCEVGFSRSDSMFCNGYLRFDMSRENGRFVASSPYGYVQQGKDESGKLIQATTPFMEIGKCSEI